MADPITTVKADAAKVADVANAGTAQAVSARNAFLDFVSNHPKTACFIMVAEAVAVVAALIR